MTTNPLPPQRKWRAIAVATVILAPAFWLLPAGLAVIPFAFIALAFLSEHPSAPGAVLRAMGLCFLVGTVVLAIDVAAGMVAGVGAGGVVALRADAAHRWQTRAIAVGVATAYTLALSATTGAVVILSAPVFPLTAIGVADHLRERRLIRARA